MTVQKMTTINPHCPSCGSELVTINRSGWLSCRKCQTMWREDTPIGKDDDDRY
jgi:tRNA(Ile2) C34 agmatinyltransferase TiaS